MASQKDRDVIILAIHPVYVDRILNRSKRVEFRKGIIPSSVKHCAIYSTRPVSRIVAYFSVKNIDVRPIRDLWNLYGAQSGLSFEEFHSYYGERKAGTAILIDNVWKLINPLSPESPSIALKVPQSYRYLDACRWNAIRRRKSIEVGFKILRSKLQ